MASSGPPTDGFDLPFDVVKKSNGFAIDIGGSVAKVVYRDKEDWNVEKNEPKKLEGDFARVRTVMFRRENLKEVIDFIKDRCHISRPKDQQVLINSTGIGGHEFSKEIEEKLGVKLHNLTEFDCFVKSFRFLIKCTPESKFIQEISTDVQKDYEDKVKMMFEMIEKMKQADITKLTESKFEMLESDNLEAAKASVSIVQSQDDSKNYGEREDMFPCLLAMLGSGIGFMKVEADGTFAITDVSNRGGRLFLGLGAILTGAKSYEELMELAESGDGSNVDIYGRDFNVHAGSEDLYEHLQPDQLYFCFGKGVTADRDSFKKADLARSLLHMICLDLAQTTDFVLRTSGIKRVFMCGGLGNGSLTRDLLTKEFLSRAFIVGKFGEREMLFIKNGSHLGALGCFLEGCTQPEKPKTDPTVT